MSSLRVNLSQRGIGFRQRTRALPLGLKPSYCPTCGGRTVVLAPAADGVLCARCAPPWHARQRTHEDSL
jgi:hypothetical protein